MRNLGLRALDEALGGARRVAVVGFPDHNNIGDSAIWVGTRKALAELGVEVAYVATWWSYDPHRTRDAVGDAPVLIHGGGNLGDRYPREQNLRERVLKDLRDRLVVQLPQTVSFADQAKARTFAALALRHPALRVMVRDTGSAEALDRVGVPSTLVPDLAFAINDVPTATIRVPGAPSRSGTPPDVVWIARTDVERQASADRYAESAGVQMTDWQSLLGPPGGWPEEQRTALETVSAFAHRSLAEARFAVRAARRAAAQLGILEDRPSFGRRALPRENLVEFASALEVLAEYRLGRGLALLSSAETVVTDRLHAHVLSLLSGIPSVAYDNSDQKLSRYWRTWSPPSSLATWVASPDEAWEYVRQG
jgi:pyruvyl transferase EpsO